MLENVFSVCYNLLEIWVCVHIAARISEIKVNEYGGAAARKKLDAAKANQKNV